MRNLYIACDHITGPTLYYRVIWCATYDLDFLPWTNFENVLYLLFKPAWLMGIESTNGNNCFTVRMQQSMIRTKPIKQLCLAHNWKCTQANISLLSLEQTDLTFRGWLWVCNINKFLAGKMYNLLYVERDLDNKNTRIDLNTLMHAVTPSSSECDFLYRLLCLHSHLLQASRS